VNPASTSPSQNSPHIHNNTLNKSNERIESNITNNNNNNNENNRSELPNYEKMFAINRIEVKCESKRDQIANELLITEQNYVRYLKILIHVWMKPMEEAAKKGAIDFSVENVHRIFNGIVFSYLFDLNSFYIHIHSMFRKKKQVKNKHSIDITFDICMLGIEDILQVNTLLVEKLEEKMKNWGPKQTLGDVLLKLVPLFVAPFLFSFPSFCK
jgi:hypothetical protein